MIFKDFLYKSKQKHGDKYEYPYSDDKIKCEDKVKVICKLHGEFLISPYHHINGSGCKICGGRGKYNTSDFIKKAKTIHNDYYNYDKVIYINKDNLVIIICPIHGEFLQKPHNHISGCGCPKCGGSLVKLDSEFINQSNIIHNNKYDYSLVNYKNNKTKVKIICKLHGIFEQTPDKHLQGNSCPKCNLKSQSKLFDKLKINLNNVRLLWEYSPEWLDKQRFDIYLPDYNIAIEYNGEQHYIPMSIYGGNIGFDVIKERDIMKRNKCDKNNCTLFELKYDYNENDYEKLVTDIQLIIKNKNKWK